MSKNDKDLVMVDESEKGVHPNYFFDDKETENNTLVETTSTDVMIEQAIAAGVVHHVQNSQEVKDKIIKTTDALIDAKLDEKKSNADKAVKKAYFEANEAACTYFGYDEKTTSKSHIKMMKAWAWFFNTLYIVTLGFFLVAPISFFFHKLKVVIKHSWLVLILAILIYALIVLTPFFITWLRRV